MKIIQVKKKEQISVISSSVYQARKERITNFHEQFSSIAEASKTDFQKIAKDTDQFTMEYSFISLFPDLVLDLGKGD